MKKQSPRKPREAHRTKLEIEMESLAKRRSKAIMEAGLLNFVLLNGKCIKDCTFAEVRQMGEFFIDLADS